jgi:hypothetical protein
MTPEQEAQLRRLKACRPFMMAFGAIMANGEFIMWSAGTKHRCNVLARQGAKVFCL